MIDAAQLPVRMRCTRSIPIPPASSCRGLSLVEVMIAMVLGLIVVLGVVSVMSNNRQNYRITETLSELQENGRMAFEIVARDIRAARDTGCGPTPVTDTLLPAGTEWWRVWRPLRGFDGATTAVAIGSGVGERVADTHALQLQGTRDGWPLTNSTPDAIEVTSLADNPFKANDIIVLCDLSTATSTLHRITNVSGSKVGIQPATNASDGQLAHLRSITWYIGNNGRDDEGGRSLYRVRYEGDAPPVTEEILPGIADMQLRFRIADNPNLQDISAITLANWERVNAIEVTFTVESTQANVTTAPDADAQVGDDNRLRRRFTHIVAIRNTAP